MSVLYVVSYRECLLRASWIYSLRLIITVPKFLSQGVVMKFSNGFLCLFKLFADIGLSDIYMVQSSLENFLGILLLLEIS